VHHTAITLLGNVISSTTKQHLKEIRMLDTQAIQGSEEAEEIRVQLRHLQHLFHNHRTLADSVSKALDSGHTSAAELEVLRNEMDKFTSEQGVLRKYAHGCTGTQIE
jgi:hypothetical protein